jgi:hypothetical protein
MSSRPVSLDDVKRSQREERGDKKGSLERRDLRLVVGLSSHLLEERDGFLRLSDSAAGVLHIDQSRKD